jgi:hypothetical protein
MSVKATSGPRVPELVHFDLVEKRLVADLESSGRFHPIAANLLEHVLDENGLDRSRRAAGDFFEPEPRHARRRLSCFPRRIDLRGGRLLLGFGPADVGGAGWPRQLGPLQ